MEGLNILLRAILDLSELDWVVSDVSHDSICEQVILDSVTFELLNTLVIFSLGLSVELQFSVFDKLVQEELTIEVILGLIICQV